MRVGIDTRSAFGQRTGIGRHTACLPQDMRGAMSERGVRRAVRFTCQETARRTVAVYKEMVS